MFSNLQSFLKSSAGQALAQQLLQQGSEDLQQAFAAGDAMVRLLEKAHYSIQQKNPDEAKEFERAARQITAAYCKHKARYIESRAKFTL